MLVSMTASSEQDLPRNIDFLYSKNRLKRGHLAGQVQSDRRGHPALDGDRLPDAGADGFGQFALLAGRGRAVMPASHAERRPRSVGRYPHSWGCAPV